MRFAATAVACLAGLAPVAALVLWSYGLATFQTLFLAVSLPGSVVILALALTAGRWDVDLARRMGAGVVGGVLGTIAYDVIRAPFQVVGLRLMTPIDSYGVLLVNVARSSPLTGFAGWAYHFSDGIGFGVAYAVVIGGRSWRWALLWGATLETSSLITPLGGLYGLTGKVGVIAVAYLGHFAYAVVLGKVVHGAHRARGGPSALSPRAPVFAVLALVVVLGVWLRPWTGARHVDPGRHLRGLPTAAVRDGRFSPEWLRVAPGGCVALRNDDTVGYTLSSGSPSILAAGGVARVCYQGAGIHRVKTSGKPFSGGFVIVDPAL